MNNIFSNVNFDICFLKTYLAILKNREVVNYREQTRKVIEKATEELAFDFQNTDLDINDIFTYLTNHLQQNPEIFGNAFAFSPEIHCSCPFVFRVKNGFESRDIAKEFGYSKTVWYEVPVKQRKAVWSVPYFDIGKAGEDILLTTYSIPVFNKHSMLIGVIISDLLLAKLEDIQKIE
ncbi:PDC sensor domain-containing protein [Plectonema cf. radiosum LEGE 06105]|uniref:PDC sensor domain-containing protein n=1 Tax=Plectonema cf. radiosum LEGE 06105 TaxID=945769 RepID=A0A8J7F961_9CYAN|nr:cache domain-containing protein [Plectonema radiosum]MBE9214479.1 PDC sensor domain-containing protein [Plectonema cf. radiosum LEGE 06105]